MYLAHFASFAKPSVTVLSVGAAADSRPDPP